MIFGDFLSFSTTIFVVEWMWFSLCYLCVEKLRFQVLIWDEWIFALHVLLFRCLIVVLSGVMWIFACVDWIFCNLVWLWREKEIFYLTKLCIHSIWFTLTMISECVCCHHIRLKATESTPFGCMKQCSLDTTPVIIRESGSE